MKARVGRTLLSDAFDFGFASALVVVFVFFDECGLTSIPRADSR